MQKRKPLVIGNWKMYVEAPEAAKAFAAGLRRRSRQFAGVEAMLAPAYPLISVVAAALKGSSIQVAAQNVSAFNDSKHTGEVSSTMLKRAGLTAALVGHSEAREAGESNELIHKKIAELTHAGLTTVLCIGERERDQAGSHFSFVEEQLSSALRGFVKKEIPSLIIAYEPVFTIGKSAADAMRPADVREMSIFIKKTLADIFDRTLALKVPILYGGSVEASNAAALIAEGDVNGFLVGHASSDLDSFVEILKAVRN